ncbi:MAG: hypothetical protein ACP5EP_12250 [Acidobacteriaceae bacterium]
MEIDNTVRLPGDCQRIAVVGRTGSGKTQAALWHLSNASIDTKPWVAINHKFDEHIDAIARAVDINFSTLPSVPGIYRLHPLPSESEELDEFLWKVWAAGNIGIYIDEGYMVRKTDAFNACLTQGRSKHIPMIVLTQRPVRVSPFVFSECDFLQVFQLNKKRDKQTIEENSRIDMENELPQYHSYYFDVAQNKVAHFGPVPEIQYILNRIDKKLPLPENMQEKIAETSRRKINKI